MIPTLLNEHLFFRIDVTSQRTKAIHGLFLTLGKWCQVPQRAIYKLRDKWGIFKYPCEYQIFFVKTRRSIIREISLISEYDVTLRKTQRDDPIGEERKRKPRKRILLWSPHIKNRQDMDRIEILVGASKTSGQLFASLLNRFYCEGFELAPETLEEIFRNLLRIGNTEGIRAINRVCFNRPSRYYRVNLWNVKSKETLEALTGFFRCSSAGLGKMFVESMWEFPAPTERIPLEVTKAFLDDLKLSPERLLSFWPSVFRGESFRYILERLEPQPLSTNDFLGLLLWSILNEKDTDNDLEILLKAYPQVSSVYFFPHANYMSTPASIFHTSKTLNLSTPLRARCFFDLLYGKDFHKKHLYDLLHPKGTLLFYPALVGELVVRAKDLLESNEGILLLFGATESLVRSGTPIDDLVFDSVLTLLESIMGYRELISDTLTH